MAHHEIKPGQVFKVIGWIEEFPFTKIMNVNINIKEKEKVCNCMVRNSDMLIEICYR